MERTEIIKALECCEGGGKPCLSCPYFYKAVDTSCAPFLIKDALSLIKELTVENERLRAENPTVYRDVPLGKVRDQIAKEMLNDES